MTIDELRKVTNGCELKQIATDVFEVIGDCKFNNEQAVLDAFFNYGEICVFYTDDFQVKYVAASSDALDLVMDGEVPSLDFDDYNTYQTGSRGLSLGEVFL